MARDAGRPEGRGRAPRLGDSRAARSWPGPGAGPRTPDTPGSLCCGGGGSGPGSRRHLPSQPARPGAPCACVLSSRPEWAGPSTAYLHWSKRCEGGSRERRPAHRCPLWGPGTAPRAGNPDCGSGGSDVPTRVGRGVGGRHGPGPQLPSRLGLPAQGPEPHSWALPIWGSGPQTPRPLSLAVQLEEPGRCPPGPPN